MKKIFICGIIGKENFVYIRDCVKLHQSLENNKGKDKKRKADESGRVYVRSGKNRERDW